MPDLDDARAAEPCPARAPGPRPGHRAGRALTAASALVAAGLVTGCAGKPVKSAASPATQKNIGYLTPSLLLPDVTDSARGVVAREPTERFLLLDRMRIVTDEEGTLRRARELLPHGNASAQRLPERLGGGFLFTISNSGTTQLWRSAKFDGDLVPIARVGFTSSEVVAGFDRLYVRQPGTARVSAFDVDTGEPRSVAPLPLAAGYGGMAFADGWRAVVDTDLRGPLVTFDAGATWRPVEVEHRITSISAIDGDPVLMTYGGRYVIDARGRVSQQQDGYRPTDSAPKAKAPPPKPFGKWPLRTAIEAGWPDSATSIVVAREGALGRIELPSGKMLATKLDAYPEKEARCQAIRQGRGGGFGFLCGERDGETVVYGFRPPLGLERVVGWKTPRQVAPSGNGSLVVRGPCLDEKKPEADDDDEPPKKAPPKAAAPAGAVYCIVDTFGSTREIRVKGDVGVERVVALSDGRVVILVPPRGDTEGQISVLSQGRVKTSKLTLPQEPKNTLRELRRGLWQQGFEEREKGVIGGWVEAGGASVGVTVTLDGKVKAGELRYESNGLLTSGRFGLAVGDTQRLAESIDGGMTWRSFNGPERSLYALRSDAKRDRRPARGCGPAGCVYEGWVRLGWGESPRGDLETAEMPSRPGKMARIVPPLAASCELAYAVTPPVAHKPVVMAPQPERNPNPGGYYYGPRFGLGAWLPFRNMAPPAITKDEIGYDGGPTTDVVSLRAYVWGKAGADWGRTSKWLLRFDDRYDVQGGVRSSAVTTSPFPDWQRASEAVMGGRISAFLDPGGRHALIHQSGYGPVGFYAVADGQPVMSVKDARGAAPYRAPLPNTAVRVGESWFYLTQGNYSSGVAEIEVHRIDLGVTRRVAVLRRASEPNRYGTSLESPRLVRRARSAQIGVLVAAPPDPGERPQRWLVHPLDTETYKLGDPIELGTRDWGGKLPPRCAPERDGWLVEALPEAGANLTFGGESRAIVGTPELRLRLDPGFVCTEGLSVTAEGFVDPPKGAKVAPRPLPLDSKLVPFAATLRSNGERRIYQCK